MYIVPGKGMELESQHWLVFFFKYYYSTSDEIHKGGIDV